MGNKLPKVVANTTDPEFRIMPARSRHADDACDWARYRFEVSRGSAAPCPPCPAHRAGEGEPGTADGSVLVRRVRRQRRLGGCQSAAAEALGRRPGSAPPVRQSLTTTVWVVRSWLERVLLRERGSCWGRCGWCRAGWWSSGWAAQVGWVRYVGGLCLALRGGGLGLVACRWWWRRERCHWHRRFRWRGYGFRRSVWR